MRGAAVLALGAVLVAAGCFGSGGGGGSAGTATQTSASGSSTTGTGPFFDGEAAYAFTAALVTSADGSPAFRVPGTPAHREAAQRLASMMEAVEGWEVSWQNFTGEDYQGLDKGEVKVYYESPSYCEPAERERLRGLAFSNLVARMDGEGDRTFLLGAHWESKRFATQDPVTANRTQPVLGANDGASGVGVLVQLMWQLRGAHFPFDIEIVFFDGEDGFEDCHPLAGSLWYVQGLEAAEAEGMRMLLLDMVGDPDAQFIRESHGVACDPDLVDLLYAKAGRNGLAGNFRDATTTLHDDHVSFTQAGIPAVDLIDYGRGFPPYWHTTHDTMDNLDAGMMGRVGALALDVMQDADFSASWPGPC